MLQIDEPVFVQTFISNALFVRFNISIVIRLAWLNQSQFNAVAKCRAQHLVAEKLFATVGANDLRKSSNCVQLVQYPRKCATTNRTLCNNINAIGRRIVHNLQTFDRAPVSAAFKHEVNGPGRSGLARG